MNKISVEKYLIEIGSTIKSAMEIIDQNATGICFIIKDDAIVGVATDGDIRRALIKGISIDDKIEKVMNKDYKSLPIKADEKTIAKNLTIKHKIIPLLDEKNKIIDIAEFRNSHRIPVLEPEFNGKELEYVQECITSTWISSQGRFVTLFEEMMEDIHDETFAVSVSNGTTALHLALVTLGIGADDEVIVPNLTFAASANAAIYCGAKPVLCEISKDTWCIDASEIEKLITRRTKAIMPVHLYGQMSNMSEIMNLANKYNLLVIEDCAEAIGSKYRGSNAGTFGHAATFSFFGNKTITTGEGGMVLFKDKDLAEKAKVLRDHGMNKERRYWHDEVGFNYRLTNLQAAVGVAQLERFDEIIHKKMKVFDWYSKYLRKISAVSQMPFIDENILNSNWLYTIVLDEKIPINKLILKLKEAGIETRPVFYPLDMMPPYESYRKSSSLQQSYRVSTHGISLPTSITLDEKKIQIITNELDVEIRRLS